MTIGQYLVSFSVLACLVVVALMLLTRWGGLALVGAASLLVVATAVSFIARDGGRTGPGALRSSVIAAAAIAVCALVVYRRGSRGGASRRLITGVLAWLGLFFAWFGTAYLLRS